MKMKKKLIPFIATIACGAACACALVACGDDPGEEKGVDVTASVSFAYVGNNENATIEVRRLSFPDDYPLVDHEMNGGVSVSTASFKSTKKKDPVLEITCHYAYDISTAQITEKSGQPFTTRVDEGSNTMFITMPFATTISYEFEAGEPSVRTEVVKFGAPEEDVLTQSQNATLKHIVEHAMIYVEDGSGAKNFAPFSVYNQDEQKNVFNLEGKHVVADMSEGFFAVYAYFDATDHERIIYNSYADIIGLKKTNGNIATADSVKYMKVPGTETYAYRYYFDTNDLFDNENGHGIAAKDCAIVLNTSEIRNEFIKSKISKSFSTRPYNYYGDTHYDFELVQYKVGSGDWIAAEEKDVDKEYDKAYTLKYKFTKYEVIRGSEKDEDATAKHLAAIDFSAIKLSINGKTLTSDQCVYEKVGDEHFYTITIGRDDIPTDYGHTDQQYKGKYFKVGLAVDSLKTIDTVRSVTLTAANGISGSVSWSSLYAIYDAADGKSQVTKEMLNDGYGLDVSGNVDSTEHLKQCKIKVTVDGQAYTSRLYKFGEDYAVDMESTGIYSAFGDAKLLSNQGSEYTSDYVLGEEGAAKYVKFYHSQGGLGYAIHDSNPSSNDIKIKVELVEVEYMPITVKKGETKDSRVEFEYVKMSDREVTEQGVEIESTGSNYSADYDLFMKIVAAETVSENSIFDFTVEYYSNGVKVAESGLDVHSTIEGWTTDASGQSVAVGSGGGSGTAGKYTESRFDFKCKNPTMHFYQVDEYEVAYNSVFVVIDEIVISPTLSEPMSAE